MTLRYEWGIDLQHCPISCTLTPASVGAFAFSASSGTYALTDLSSVMGAGEYVALAGGLQTLINNALTAATATERVSVAWAWPTGFTVTLTAGTSLAFGFNVSSESDVRMRAILGWQGNRTLTTSEVSDARPWLVINPAQQCRSLPLTEEYEPEGIASEAVADDGADYLISRDTSELWSDWVQVAEVAAGPAAFASPGTPPRKRHATALVPFTYQAAWEHARKGHHPFLVVENDTADVHRLRADGASFNPQRFGGERTGYWQINFRTRYLGEITTGPLLDYSGATFARTSEASFVDPRSSWAFAETGAGAWKAPGEARLFSDGAILIEGARTNQMLQSETPSNAAWTALNSPTISGTGAAPDGGADVETVTFAVGGAAGQIRQALSAGSFTDGLNSAVSYWIAGNGSAQADDYWRDKVPANFLDTFTPGATLARKLVARANATGSFGPLAGLIEQTDGAAFDLWGFQVEANADFCSSYIRTTTTTATRAAEFCTVAAGNVPAEFLTGSWSVIVTPSYATADAPALAYVYYLDASNYLALVSGTTVRLRANGVNYDVAGLSWAAFETLTITVDFGGSLIVVGGGGGSTSPANDWSGAAVDLRVGSDGAGNHLFGVVSRPQSV